MSQSRWARAANEDARPAKESGPRFDFPTVPAEHRHVRALLENAMRYLAPESGTTDLASGYPVEGWNDDPARGFRLRSFTQLTAIGQWLEVHANVVAGHADTPYLSREQALNRLVLAAETLCRDQADPQLGAKGLLGNFLDLASGKRLGPLAGDVDKQRFLDAFGRKKGEAVWQALTAKGWIVPESDGRQAGIRRGANYGLAFFDGPLAPYTDDATKTRIMALLDQRVVTVVFGDNANLTASVAKAIGALQHPALGDDPRIAEVRRQLERFLENQREGYTYLYDAKAGLFAFGWDATRNRMLGWEDGHGNWQVGHMDYMVNEFRGPATFVVLRYGLPPAAIKNLGFKVKPYRTQEGTDRYVPAPWEGSAFQSLGLALSMMELGSPSWRHILGQVVEIELDYARRNRLPGFLSESYVGDQTRYTGDVGIPDIAVTTMPRITNVASLYTLGVAYMVAPAKIEQFLASNWPVISTLLTDHGPWEGFDVIRQEPVRVQTTAHTLALVLGFLGTGSEQMARYLDSKGLGPQLAEIYRPGAKLDLLSAATEVFAWADKGSTIKSARENGRFSVKGERVNQVGIAFVHPQGMDLSGGVLRIGYRSTEPIERAVIGLKPSHSAAPPKIPTELYARFADTDGREEEIQVPLPATPGLTGIGEVVLTYGPGQQGGPTDLCITRLTFAPAVQ